MTDQTYYIVGEMQLRRAEEGHVEEVFKRIRGQKVSIDMLVSTGVISQRVLDLFKEKIQ